MLIKSIQLKNYRQFVDERIDFAANPEKNVTIIIGENGAGKTPFAQAFTWCLYGKTEFSDKVLLNRNVADNLDGGATADVVVTIVLSYGENEYSIKREQTYKREYSGRLSSENTRIHIQYRDNVGNTNHVQPTQIERTIREILPEELSNYFFFNGERIENMSKDIASGHKATDFADAVKGLLGLDGMAKAIEHFKSKSGVISSFEARFNASSDSEVKRLTSEIEELDKKINNLKDENDKLEENITSARSRKESRRLEMVQYEPGKNYQEQKDKLIEEIKHIETMKAKYYGNICKTFNSNAESVFSRPLIAGCLGVLKNEKVSNVDIPNLHANTINRLLSDGICICGTCLSEGTLPYMKLKSLIEYLPPHSISTSIASFKAESRRRLNNMPENLAQEINECLEVISSQNDEIDDKKDEVSQLEKKLDDKDVLEKVRKINEEIKLCDKTIEEDSLTKDQNKETIGRLSEERDRKISERRTYNLKSNDNKKIEVWKKYAEAIYNDLTSEYARKEAEIRMRLQETINKIFADIYQGGLSLSIDDKYHISVTATDYIGPAVETSTAQSIAVIFAFITGIIKLARENADRFKGDDAEMLTSEPYPLVMDAPLSAFDKRRIKTVCESIPKTAEQVVIFIKDTDGELAEEHMSDVIGSRHHFIKIDEFNTKLD